MANRKRNIQMKFWVTEEEKTAHRREDEPAPHKAVWGIPAENGD